MSISKQLAKHIRDVHFGGNWTVSNLHEAVSTLTWQQATMKIDGCNTIAALLYHVNYFISAVLKVLHGNKLDANDKFSFDVPEIKSQEDWEKLSNRVWKEAEEFAGLAEQLPDKILDEKFEDEKYGTYYRNLAGIIEHMHYHLGQIVIIKKFVVKQV